MGDFWFAAFQRGMLQEMDFTGFSVIKPWFCWLAVKYHLIRSWSWISQPVFFVCVWAILEAHDPSYFFVSYDIMQCQCWKQCKTGAEEKSIAARMYGWKHDWNITGEDFRDCKGSASWILEVEINNSLRMIGQAPLNMVRWKTGSFSLMAFFQCGQCESPSDGNKAARCWSAMWASYLVLLQKNLRNVPRTVVTSGFYVSDVGFERLFEKLPWGNEDSPNSFLYKKCWWFGSTLKNVWRGWCINIS